MACVAAAAMALFAGERAGAAISFTGSPAVVDFDSMAGALGAVNFANDSTVTGLYLFNSGGTTLGGGTPATVYRSSSTTGNYPFFWYRPTATSTEVSLGFLNTDGNSSGLGAGYIAAGLLFVNNTGQSIPMVTLDYEVFGSTATFTEADPVSVSWAINATDVLDSSATWTTVPGLGYSIAADATITGPTTNVISGLNWLPGQMLMIRFKDINVGGTDRFSRIDNITLIPEPSAMMLAGLGGMLAGLRRRR